MVYVCIFRDHSVIQCTFFSLKDVQRYLFNAGVILVHNDQSNTFVHIQSDSNLCFMFVFLEMGVSCSAL